MGQDLWIPETNDHELPSKETEGVDEELKVASLISKELKKKSVKN